MKFILKILYRIVVIVLCGILFVNVWLAVSGTILGQNPPSVAGYSQLIVASGSMEPFLEVGEMIIISKKKEYSVGDVITFRQDGMIVTHRIIEKTVDGFITQGDANNAADDPIQSEQIIGKVIATSKIFGNFLLFLKSPLGILTVMISIFILVKISGRVGYKNES